MPRFRPYQGYGGPVGDEVAVPADAAEMDWVGSPPRYPGPRRRLPNAHRAVATSQTLPFFVSPPDLGGPSRKVLQVPRVVVRGGVFDDNRLRRFTEVVETILNSFLRKGRIAQLQDPDDFELIAGGFSATRDPGTTDDVSRGARAGITWLNRTTRKLFVCIDATAGAADWEQVN